MKHRNLFRHAAVTAVAVTLGLGAASAEAAVQAGNYQTHKLPSTTRNTVQNHAPVQHVADNDQGAVQSGNYQDHLLPSTTRHTAPVEATRHDQEVAVNGERRDSH